MHEIDCRPYPFSLFVTESATEYGECDVERNGGHCSREGSVFYVWAHDINFLAHELLHVCLEIMEHCEIVVSAENSEPFCYFFQSVFSQSIEKLGW